MIISSNNIIAHYKLIFDGLIIMFKSDGIFSRPSLSILSKAIEKFRSLSFHRNIFGGGMRRQKKIRNKSNRETDQSSEEERSSNWKSLFKSSSNVIINKVSWNSPKIRHPSGPCSKRFYVHKGQSSTYHEVLQIQETMLIMTMIIVIPLWKGTRLTWEKRKKECLKQWTNDEVLNRESRTDKLEEISDKV